MERPAALLAVILLLVGCQSTKSSFDPFAIYGPRRVPPPATGTIGQPNSYDQPPATLPAAPPVSSSLPPVNLQQPPSGLPPRQTRTTPAQSVSSASAAQWQPAAAPNSVHAAADQSAVISGGTRVASMRESDNLRWTRPEPTALRSGRPASVVSTPPTPSRPGGSQQNEVPSGGEPKPFSPSGHLLEITELPGYTPSTFSPAVGYPAPASALVPLPHAQVSAPRATPVTSDRSSLSAGGVQKTDQPRSSDALGWKQRTTP
jgi:hypothetical protein